jgi:hypothetical protein
LCLCVCVCVCVRVRARARDDPQNKQQLFQQEYVQIGH